jgi:bacterial/archaeal transporter family-2 protein
MAFVLIAVALALGALASIQPGVNGRMRTAVGDPIFAALVSTTFSTTSLLIYTLIRQPARPSFDKLAAGPWWMWTGGFIGAAYVALAIILTQKIGSAAMMAAIVVGQMVAAMVIDHFGVFGLEVREITPTRLLGVLLLFAGVALIRYF